MEGLGRVARMQNDFEVVARRARASDAEAEAAGGVPGDVDVAVEPGEHGCAR